MWKTFPTSKVDLHRSGASAGGASVPPGNLARRATLATSLPALSSAPALANGCVHDPSGVSTTCTGNPALPILVTQNAGLTITALSNDPVSAPGPPVAVMSNPAGPGSPALASTLTFNDGAHGLQVDNAIGLLASTEGGMGESSVLGPFNASGGPGGTARQPRFW